MKFLRKLLFWGFAIAYIIACPALILYALGYIYNPIAGELERTGVLHIKSVPEGADIFLEDSRYTKRSPATINELLAGSYNLTLKKNGYKLWTQRVTIEGGKAVAFNDILLIPDAWPAKNITAGKFEDLINTGNDHSFLVAAGPALGSYFVYDIDKGISPLLAVGSPLSTISVNKIYDCIKGNTIVAEGGSFWDRKYLYLNPSADEPCAVDITKLAEGGISRDVWQGSGNVLFYRQDKCLNRIEIKENILFPCYMEQIKGFGISGEWIYVIDPNGSLIRRTFDGSKEENLSTDIFIAQQFFKRSKFHFIDIRSEKTFFFLGTEGDFLVNLPPYSIANESVEGYKFSGNRNLLLFWTKTSISTADFSTKEDDVVFHENFRVKSEYQNGKNIRQCLWADDKSHILFNDSSNVYLMEIEPQGAAHIEFAVKIKDNTEIFYDTKEKTLFYIDKDSGFLRKIEIIPKQSLIPSGLTQ